MPSILELLAANPTLRILAQMAQAQTGSNQTSTSQSAPPMPTPKQTPIAPIPVRDSNPYPADKPKSTFNPSTTSTDELRSLVSSDQFSGRNLTQDILDKGGTGLGRFFRSLGRSVLSDFNPEAVQTRELFEQARIEGSPIRRSILDVLSQREAAEKQAELSARAAEAKYSRRTFLERAAQPRAEREVVIPFKPFERQTDFDPSRISQGIAEGVFTPEEGSRLLQAGGMPEDTRQKRQTLDISERSLANTISTDAQNLDLRRRELALRGREFAQRGASDSISAQRLALDTKKAILDYSKELSSAGVPSATAEWVSRLEYNTDPSFLLKDEAYIGLSSVIGLYKDRRMEMGDALNRLELFGRALSNDNITGAAKTNLKGMLEGVTGLMKSRLGLNQDMSLLDPIEQVKARVFLLEQFPPSLQSAILKSEKFGEEFDKGFFGKPKNEDKQTQPSDIPPLFGDTGQGISDLGTLLGEGARVAGSAAALGLSTSTRSVFGSLPTSRSGAEKLYGVSLPSNWESMSQQDKLAAIHRAKLLFTPSKVKTK